MGRILAATLLLDSLTVMAGLHFVVIQQRILKKWVSTDRERADPYKGPTMAPDLFWKSLETK